jgi:alkanesulfonate monooxygenase SsuD/methylene tetrahydromethanopterin reductase-like flavin-dependent oxidoreductase (luciferase family)
VERKIRFATQSGGQPTGAEWLARAKRLEDIGYATLSMPDHMVGGAWSNMPALGTAAAVTSKLRLGNLVLDNDFRNPVVLAREFATLDVISGGRVEIGLGVGWFDRDYQGTGIPFDRGRIRVECGARPASPTSACAAHIPRSSHPLSATYPVPKR